MAKYEVWDVSPSTQQCVLETENKSEAMRVAAEYDRHLTKRERALGYAVEIRKDAQTDEYGCYSYNTVAFKN